MHLITYATVFETDFEATNAASWISDYVFKAEIGDSLKAASTAECRLPVA